MCFLLNWTHVCLRMPRLYTFDPFSCSTVTRFRSDRLGSPEKWSSKGPDKTMTNGRNMALCNGILWRGWVIKETIKETKKETSGPNCEWFLGLNKHVLRTLHLLYMKTHVFFRILRSRTVSFQNKKPHVFFPQNPCKFYEIARFLHAQKHYCEPNAPKTNWTNHIKVYRHAVIVCKFMVPQFALCSVALRFWQGLWQLWQTTNRKGQFVIHVFFLMMIPCFLFSDIQSIQCIQDEWPYRIQNKKPHFWLWFNWFSHQRHEPSWILVINNFIEHLGFPWLRICRPRHRAGTIFLNPRRRQFSK